MLAEIHAYNEGVARCYHCFFPVSSFARVQWFDVSFAQVLLLYLCITSFGTTSIIIFKMSQEGFGHL